ncbi:MAG: carboxypeptidase regulatory-like domain-containing protein [Caldilinea sp. CFX5]|nr:carboxypeptidase regulatory-like domain-containing protein [Caldilinea sp. CFX5]
MSSEIISQQPEVTGLPPAKSEKGIVLSSEAPIPINVAVYTASGDPIEKAEVKVAAVKVDDAVYLTGVNGKVTFNLPPGRYTISVNAFGKVSTRSIRVNAGDACLDVKFEIGDGQLATAPLDWRTHSDFVQAGETITVTADHAPDANCSYVWLSTAGNFVEQGEEQNARAIHFIVPTAQNGPIDITALVTHDGGSSISLRKRVFVVPATASHGRSDLPIPLPVSLQRSLPPDTDDKALWVAIRNRTKAIAFNSYKRFIDRVLCQGEINQGSNSENGALLARQYYESGAALHGVTAYELLKTATQAFLLLQCGLVIDERFYKPSEEASRLGAPVPLGEIRQRLANYLGDDKLPYIKRILDATLVELNGADNPFCNGYLNARINPCMMELIWSYWEEAGGLVQTLNAISLRFQNQRGPLENDPLAHFETSPLRTLNNVLWGYIQGEDDRLTVLRRAHEYIHHYGLALQGKAVANLRPVDSRSKFLEAFHNLLYLLTVFYKQADDTTYVPDAFSVLNALREVHLLLAEGAHNQFGDLPWTARAEMLIQQWLLARPELREFLQSRPMVPYKEPWMAQVDTMKKLQGWTDVSVSHFHDLAIYGEPLLLAVRYGNWVDVSDPAQAANWAHYWRPEVQGYIHAYRAATGVDLTANVTDSQQAALRITQPSVLLRQRLPGALSPALPAPAAPPLPAPFRLRRALRRTT